MTSPYLMNTYNPLPVPMAAGLFGKAFGHRLVELGPFGLGPWVMPIVASYTLQMAHS